MAQTSIEEALEVNKMLKRNMKRIRQVLDEKHGQIKAKERKEIEKEKAGGGRN